MYSSIQRLNIFEYGNYRSYLRDFYRLRKERDRRFSYRYLSRAAGFRSPNFFKLVMDGERNLSPESIGKVSKALGLSKAEARHFQNLVLLNQAETVEEKRFYAERLMGSRFVKNLHPLKPAQYAYYSHWYYIPIREMVALKDFREDADWIARRLDPPITAAEARKALQDLHRLGLVKRDTDGRLVQTEAFVSTGDEVSSASVVQFQTEMIHKGAESIDRISREKRDVSSLTLSLSEQSARQVKELIQRFRKELLAISSQDETADAVYQIGFQLFPLTQEAPVLTQEPPAGPADGSGGPGLRTGSASDDRKESGEPDDSGQEAG